MGKICKSNKPFGYVRGYYLVRRSDKSRFFISEEVHLGRLERVCEQRLSDKVGWDYWVDYCYGPDVQGVTLWAGNDRTDDFHDHEIIDCLAFDN